MNKETKKMNKEWVEKQKSIGKDWSGYYKGGFIVMAIMIVLLLIYLFTK